MGCVSVLARSDERAPEPALAMRPGDFQHFRVDFADLIFFAPRQPVTITLPFSFNASPMLPVILVPRCQ